jgi:hypothetical protein
LLIKKEKKGTQAEEKISFLPGAGLTVKKRKKIKRTGENFCF